MSLGPITEEDIRMFMLDRSAADNLIDGELSFSPEEIASAMKNAARAYNGIPPFVNTVDPDCLPGQTELFLDAVAEYLYRGKIAQGARNDFDFNAGGVQANLEATRLKHYKELAQAHGEKWRESAKALKLARNLSRAWGIVGGS